MHQLLKKENFSERNKKPTKKVHQDQGKGRIFKIWLECTHKDHKSSTFLTYQANFFVCLFAQTTRDETETDGKWFPGNQQQQQVSVQQRHSVKWWKSENWNNRSDQIYCCGSDLSSAVNSIPIPLAYSHSLLQFKFERIYSSSTSSFWLPNADRLLCFEF